MANWFIHICSIFFGIFAIFTAIHAVPNAIWYPRDLGSDSARFGFILLAMGAGLALILPDRLLPAIQRIAAQSAPPPVRFLGVLVLFVCLSVAKLSGAVSQAAAFPVIAGFVLTFVFPGVVFWGVPEVSGKKISVWGLIKIVGIELQRGLKYRRYLFISLLALFFLRGLAVSIS
ncbi:MAG: hypothetical protein HRU33_22815 [Rhodobacteraceae bacterium]|nr:hypothetical protein [Paracoccaceae bacterium]